MPPLIYAARTERPLLLRDSAESGFASTTYAATARRDFLPLGTARCAWGPDRLLLARGKKVVPAPSFACASFLAGAASVASGRSIAIEPATVRTWNRKTKTCNGDHRHFQEDRLERIHRRNRHAQPANQGVRIVPDASVTGENAPSHRVLVGRVEISAAWPKRSAEGRDCLGFKLDDPSFTAPIYANVFHLRGRRWLLG